MFKKNQNKHTNVVFGSKMFLWIHFRSFFLLQNKDNLCGGKTLSSTYWIATICFLYMIRKNNNFFFVKILSKIYKNKLSSHASSRCSRKHFSAHDQKRECSTKKNDLFLSAKKKKTIQTARKLKIKQNYLKVCRFRFKNPGRLLHRRNFKSPYLSL